MSYRRPSHPFHGKFAPSPYHQATYYALFIHDESWCPHDKRWYLATSPQGKRVPMERLFRTARAAFRAFAATSAAPDPNGDGPALFQYFRVRGEWYCRRYYRQDPPRVRSWRGMRQAPRWQQFCCREDLLILMPPDD